MMTEQIIIAGFGGQGVMSLGQMIAYAVLREGKEVSCASLLRSEMRGGTANCQVVVSDEPVASPSRSVGRRGHRAQPALSRRVRARVRPGGRPVR